LRSATEPIGELAATTSATLEEPGRAPLLTATTFTGLPAACAKTSGVSAIQPRSTEPPVCAAMTFGPPRKFDH
jgi:hypothetical protein